MDEREIEGRATDRVRAWRVFEDGRGCSGAPFSVSWLDEDGSGSEAGKATKASFSFLMVADFKVYCIEPKEVLAGGGEGGNDAALEERARLDN